MLTNVLGFVYVLDKLFEFFSVRNPMLSDLEVLEISGVYLHTAGSDGSECRNSYSIYF
jgi:hypothetical protein